MKWKIGILYGFLVWLIPFVISFLIYPLKTGGNPLFETILPIILVLLWINIFVFIPEKRFFFNNVKRIRNRSFIFLNKYYF